MSQIRNKRWYAVVFAVALALIGAGNALAAGFGSWGY
jgi:hypothetical protein